MKAAYLALLICNAVLPSVYFITGAVTRQLSGNIICLGVAPACR